MTKNSIFFNHSFEKKRLKALISWIHKTFGEKEALRVVDELKVTGFTNATRAGLSIGLHDLVTPPEKSLLISKAQVAMNKTDKDFKGGKITATERSQRIIDTWHRTSDTLRKQVVDHFNTYDQLNSVYIMALSGARGNFSQVRQLIGMRGLMADPQGQIISFPIRSNFREGLTLTEYFISCSGARKGLVDTALRTADTGYLTRRLVDVSHQVVIKRVACKTSRGIVLKALQTGPVGGSNKIMLSLKDRLIGRVLAEDINVQGRPPAQSPGHVEPITERTAPAIGPTLAWAALKLPALANRNSAARLRLSPRRAERSSCLAPKGLSTGSPKANLGLRPYGGNGNSDSTIALRDKIADRLTGTDRADGQAELLPPGTTFRLHGFAEGEPRNKHRREAPARYASSAKSTQHKTSDFMQADHYLMDDQNLNQLPSSAPLDTLTYTLATRDSEISPDLAFKIACLRDQVIVRSSLTCACTHEVCQLCYGWSLSQGKLVSLGEAVGVIAAQSIGEPGTQLTMRTFHTGGVFSGDLLQDIRAPHAGKVFFPQALQGLLVRTAQGQIAFLIKIPGALLLDDGKSQVTRIQLEAATMLFVRQGEVIESNTVIGELAVMTKEGNQPIKSRQTLFAEFGGRVTHHRGRTLKIHKPETDEQPLFRARRWYDGEELDLIKDAEDGIDRLKNGFRFIEPTHSLSLGVFRVLATRVGAKESHLSKVRLMEPTLRFTEPPHRSAGTNLRLVTGTPFRLPPSGLNPRFAFVEPVLSFVEQELRSVSAKRLELRRSRAAEFRLVAPRLRFAFREPMAKRAGTEFRLDQSTFLSFIIANQANSRTRDVKASSEVGQLSHKGYLRRSFVQTLLNKKSTIASGYQDASAMNTFKTPSYVLNTIAEEGDLVDENYKDCTSSFQATEPGLQTAGTKFRLVAPRLRTRAV